MPDLGRNLVRKPLGIAVPRSLPGELFERLKHDFGNRAYLALTRRFRPNDALRLYRLEEMARTARVPTGATNDVALSRSRAPDAPGCRDLHPGGLHD